VKPLSWREHKSGKLRSAQTTLVMTELVPFYADVKSFRKLDGQAVTLAPRGYMRVLVPNQSNTKPQPPRGRVLLHERNLEDFLVHQLGHIESGLRLEARQLSTSAGRIDLLCRDSEGHFVVVELKRNRGSDQVVGQLLRYMGWVKQEHPGQRVRGIIVCERADEALEYAASAAPDVLVKKFRLSFD